MTDKRKRGGQPKSAEERKRNTLSFRVRDDLRLRIEASAERNQRSVSEEIEHSIESWFLLKPLLDVLTKADQ